MRKWISKLVRSVSPAAVEVSAASIENLEERRLCSGAYAYGINANSSSSTQFDQVVSMLRSTGTKSVRLWLGINSWSHSETGMFKYIRRYKAAGFDVTLSAVPSMKGSASTIESYFDWAAGALGGSVDRWAVGNEPDRTQWSGNLDGYVNDLLKPASEGLHSHGEKVVSAGVSWNPDDEATMVRAGMLNYVDFVGYHPYAKTISQLATNVAEVKALAGGKPLVATEWNARGHEGNASDWNDAIKASWPTIRDNFYAAYYYAAVKSNTMAGAAGVLTSGGGQNGEFYSTYRSLGGNFSGSGTVTPPVVTPPVVTPPVTTPTGNVPSSTGKPSVGGFKIVDAITGATLYSNVTSATTIKLSSLAHRQIQILASTSSNAQSVKFTFTGRATRTENSAPYTVFGNSQNVETPWYTTAGSYTLSATAYTADNALGTASTTLTLILKFV
ncbi:MAG: hypothetical protein JWM57_1726 [Phycisphaerales bacterium]|nr:hypothetical protein [Phycisphaerales bacterium]